MSEAIVDKALSSWSLADAEFKLIACRENRVYRVIDPTGSQFALRIHRPGYQTKTAMQSELDWMLSLQKGGICVPEPIPNNNGDYLLDIEGVQIDLLTWLSGQPLGATGNPLEVTDRKKTFQAIGELMANVHTLSDEWQRPANFQRPSWDRDGLLGENPLWGRFWENPKLKPAQKLLFERAREKAYLSLQEQENVLDYGLIHADMVRENILIHQNELQLIDFDDCGFGYRMFDISTTLLKNWPEEDRAKLEEYFFEGYCKTREVDKTQLPLFMLLRTLSYVGWIVPRMNEPGSEERLNRFVRMSEELAENYLSLVN